jgi:DNA-binding transcriptional MocR family regulator
MDRAAAECALECHRPKACWLTANFQNSIGSLMPDEKKRDLVKPLTRYQVPSIADDINGELYFGSTCSAPAKAYDTECLVCWVAAGRFAQQGGAPQTAPHADHPLAGPSRAGLIRGQGY